MQGIENIEKVFHAPAFFPIIHKQGKGGKSHQPLHPASIQRIRQAGEEEQNQNLYQALFPENVKQQP